MEMDDNYRDAVYRMYESSDVLFEKQQWFNANYLAGYVLECYCKLILLMAVGICFFRRTAGSKEIWTCSQRIEG